MRLGFPDQAGGGIALQQTLVRIWETPDHLQVTRFENFSHRFFNRLVPILTNKKEEAIL